MNKREKSYQETRELRDFSENLSSEFSELNAGLAPQVEPTRINFDAVRAKIEHERKITEALKQRLARWGYSETEIAAVDPWKLERAANHGGDLTPKEYAILRHFDEIRTEIKERERK